MFRQPAAGQAHGDEAGQRGGFEETAVGRLELVKAREGFIFDGVAEEAGDWIFCGRVVMDGLADGDERRQGVANDWEL